MDPVDPDSDPKHCPNVCFRSMMYGCQYYPDLIECSFKHFLARTERDHAYLKLLFLNKCVLYLKEKTSIRNFLKTVTLRNSLFSG